MVTPSGRAGQAAAATGSEQRPSAGTAPLAGSSQQMVSGGVRLQHISRPRPSLRTKSVNFQANWDFLKEGMRSVLSDPMSPPRVAIPQYHLLVYQLCTGQCYNLPSVVSSRIKEGKAAPQLLYLHLKRFLIDYIDNTVVRNVTGSRQDILIRYLEQWTNFRVGMEYIHAAFHYMNEDWVAKQPTNAQDRELGDVCEVRMLGYICWRDHLYLRMKNYIVEASLDLIERDRRGQFVEVGLLKGVIQSIVALGVDHRPPTFYSEQFEVQFLRATEAFYAREVAVKLDAGSATDQEQLLPSYMLYVETRLEEERRRLKQYLDKSTEKSLMKTLIKVAIDGRISLLLDASQAWFDQDRVEEQKRLFRLLEQSDGGLERLRKVIEDRIDSEGKAAILAVKTDAQRDPCVYVEVILRVYKKYAHMVTGIFQNHDDFKAALDKGCKRFINKNCIAASSGARSADLVAKYVHMLLKPSSKVAKTRSEKELDEALGEVLTIFGLLEDIDMFQRVYREKLSQRLIQNTYVQDQETMMITKLKKVCAYEYTYKLQRMFTDMSVSRDINQDYEGWARNHPPPEDSPTLVTNILTSVSWPQTWCTTTFAVPAPVKRVLDHFTTFYKERHQGRNLSWLHTQSNGILKTNYVRSGKSYELHVSTQQAAVLLMYDDWGASVRTWEDLVQATKLQEKELEFCVQVLVRFRVLIPSVPGNVKASKLTINEDFHSPSRKVQLHNVQHKDGQQMEDTATMKVISEDRKYSIQAAIVRLLKSRKTIQHTTLVTAVIEQLKGTFTPSHQDIKKNVENLIDKDYMERTADGKSYTYLA